MWSGVACAWSDSLEGRARPVRAGRPVVPRGVLAGAWPPRGVRALASVGHGHDEWARHGTEAGRARCGAGRAGFANWAEREAAAR